MSDKLTPQALEVETVVLGSMLLDHKSLLTVLSRLTSDSFYKLEHQKIYESMRKLNDSDIEVDILTVVNELKKNNQLEVVGGAAYVMSLTNNVASTMNIERHCLILTEKHIARELLGFSSMVSEMTYQNKDVMDINDYVSKRAYDIQNIGKFKKVDGNADLIVQLTDKIEKASREQGMTGVPTGFIELNRLIGGWQNSELYVIAARPSMGKTALMLCCAIHSSVYAEQRTLVFSGEMSRLQVMLRASSLVTDIATTTMSRGQMTETEWMMYHQEISKLETDNFVIIDDCHDIDSIVRRVKQERLDGGVDIVYLDYIQITAGKGQNRDSEIGYVTRKLKELSLDLQIPVVALAQLNRGVEGRGDKRPRLSDLRESGAIEQDADFVAFVHRPSYYDEGMPNEAYLLVRKNRNGALKDIELFFEHSKTRFRDINPY